MRLAEEVTRALAARGITAPVHISNDARPAQQAYACVDPRQRHRLRPLALR
jgi:hypothetical protein